MSISVVSNTQGLLSALKAAQAGDTIQLNPGTYASVNIKGLSFDGLVTITSSSPGNLAVLSDLKVQDSKGLLFSNLEFYVDPASTASYSHRVTSSDNIHFTGLDVHGSLNGNPADDGDGLTINGSTNVSVRDSKFHDLENGLGIVGGANAIVANNVFHHLQADGFHGGGTPFLQVLSNKFSDFYPVSGDHPDAIQLWTQGVAVAATDVSIRDNVISRGAGNPVQGIFISDQVGTLPYERLSVTGNLVVGGRYHGINVSNARNADISHNTVTGYDDQLSWLRLDKVMGATVADNDVQRLTFNESSGIAELANKIIAPVSTGAIGFLNNLLSDLLGVTAPASANLPFAGEAGASDQVGIGGAGSDLLGKAVAGTRWLEGRGGDDTLNGGDRNDYLRGDDGADSILGGGGFDDINGNAGSDTARGGDGDDWVVGGRDNDQLHGEAGNDIIYGNLGDDTAYGGDGDDLMRGGQGDDYMEGGAGSDFMSGDKGSDVLVGGGGADTFNILAGAGIDRVMDFSAAGGDRVRVEGASYTVSQVGADTVVDLGNGDQMILVGVQQSGLATGWIFGA